MKIVCMAATLDGAIGSTDKNRFYLPWLNSNPKDLHRLKETVRNNVAIITASSFEKLPKTFRNFLLENCELVIILASSAAIEGIQKVQTLLPNKVVCTTIRDNDSMWGTVSAIAYIKLGVKYTQEVDLVYIGGSHFASEAMNGADLTFMSFLPVVTDLPKEELIYLPRGENGRIF